MTELAFIELKLKDGAGGYVWVRIDTVCSVQSLLRAGCRVGLLNGDHFDVVETRQQVLDQLAKATRVVNGAWSSEVDSSTSG